MKLKTLAVVCLLCIAVALFGQSTDEGGGRGQLWPNDGTSGTTLHYLAVQSSGNAILASAGAVGIIGICDAGCGTTGSALIANRGDVLCAFTATAVVDHYVQAGLAGVCSDAGATKPSNGSDTIGQVKVGGTGAGNYLVHLQVNPNPAAAYTLPSSYIMENWAPGNALTYTLLGATGGAVHPYGFIAHGSMTSTAFEYTVTTADNTSNTYDIGVYNSSGTLLGHTGALAGTVFAPTSSVLSQSWISSFSLTFGAKYYLAIAANCTSGCAAIGGTSASQMNFNVGATALSGSNTTLPSTITPPSDSFVRATYPYVVFK